MSLKIVVKLRGEDDVTLCGASEVNKWCASQVEKQVLHGRRSWIVSVSRMAANGGLLPYVTGERLGEWLLDNAKQHWRTYPA